MDHLTTPMRLLYFAGKSFTDSLAVRMHTDLLDHLASAGVEALLVGRGPATQRQPVAHTWEGGRHVIRFAPSATATDRLLNAASKPLFHYDFFLSGARRLAGILRQETVDIVQAQMAYPYGAMAAAALQFTGQPTPLVVTLAGGDLIAAQDVGYGYARFALARRLLRYTFGRAAIVRANSPAMAARAAALGCPRERLHVVPSNIATCLLPSAPLARFRRESRAALQARLGLAKGPLLLAVSRIVPIKGLEWLVQALPPLVARWPTLTALIVGPIGAGDEAYARRLQADATRLGVGQHLHLLGPYPLEAMPTFYAAADVLVVASVFEGLGKTGIEAGANGTPCVITETAGLAHYVRSAGAGLIVPPGDPVALAEAVTSLLSNPERWAAHAAGAQRLAESFTSAVVARALLPLYASARLHQPAARRPASNAAVPDHALDAEPEQ